MMNRRSFLQALGLGIASTTIIGKLFRSAEPQTVVVKTPKLDALWSVEIEQDLRAYHSAEAERELAMLIQEEIDREVLRALNAASV